MTNNYLRHKNPYRAMRDEKRMMQARAGAATIKIGRNATHRLVIESVVRPCSELRQIDVMHELLSNEYLLPCLEYTGTSS